MSKGARGGRVGGISKFEMRKLEIGECEGENVGMWECGVGVWVLSAGDLGDVAPAVAGRRRALGFEISSGL